MARALPAALVVAAVSLAGPARADGTYFSFGAGPTTVDDELAATVTEGGHVRLAVGHRFGALAVEGFLRPEWLEADGPLSATSYGVDARYVVRLGDGVQGYVRGGLSRLRLDSYGRFDGGEPVAIGGAYERAGRGAGGGVGVQLRGKVRALGFLYWPFFFLPVGPKVDAALTFDHGVDFYRLHDPTGATDAVDARLTRFSIGFQVGKDF